MSNICYLSFPDSNSGCMGDTQFHFRTKCCQPQSSSLALATKTIRTKYECYYDEFNSKCLSLLQVCQMNEQKKMFNFHNFSYSRWINPISMVSSIFVK